MSWRSAFLLQARSDNQIRQQLNEVRAPYCHQLHYLQMTTVKLAKALLADDSDAMPPRLTHAAFVTGLKLLKRRPEIRRLLGNMRRDQFFATIDSLLPLADRIERLAPNFAGYSRPNPEYPWQAFPGAVVVAPVEFSFAEFDPRLPKMSKLLRLIDKLLAAIE